MKNLYYYNTNMLSEIKELCKGIAARIKSNQKDLYLAAVLLLVAAISFGLGWLSKIREQKIPITIEMGSSEASEPAPISDARVGGSDTESRNGSRQNSNAAAAAATMAADKIFVASKNGKKYYYAWCASVKTIKEPNRVWFSTQAEAEKAGYQPAENCKGLK
ncbi:hypothetical protein C4572_03260 [Candidatus Parcubacteria bacterium]|nr:MAG: hypothetical protein C4572_03260 [Candidatus Parcubacteria bacterium]